MDYSPLVSLKALWKKPSPRGQLLKPCSHCTFASSAASWRDVEDFCRGFEWTKTFVDLNGFRVENLRMFTWWFKVTFVGWLSDPVKGWSDLQLGDENVNLNHQVLIFLFQT